MRKKKKLKIFIIIIISIPLMYFLSQKIPSSDKGLSLYEKTAINIYLKDKYPFEKFKIVRVEEYRKDLYHYNILNFDITDNAQELGLIDVSGNTGLLDKKEVSIVSNKDIEFELYIYYPKGLSVYLVSTLGALIKLKNYSPFYISLSSLKDNYAESTLKNFLGEIDKEIYKISKKYFKDDELVVYFNFSELSNDYYLFTSYLESLIKEGNIKDKDDFLEKLQNEKLEEAFEINIIMNNEIDKLVDEEEIKKYYDICKNISNEIISELNLNKCLLDISIGEFNGDDNKFKKFKNSQNEYIRNYMNYTEIYEYYKEDGEKLYKEDTFEEFKDRYYKNMAEM